MRILLLPIGLLIIAIVGVAALQAGLASGGDDIQNVNESFTPSVGINKLDDSELDNAFYDNDTNVYRTDTTPDQEMEEGTDYLWHENNGTIEVLSGGDLDGASSAAITYSYQLTTNEEQRIAGMLAEIPRVAGVVLPVLAVLVLILFLGRGL